MAPRDEIASVMVGYALSFIGQPYRWGGDDPIKGFDCSGLVQEILSSVGLDPAGDQTADQIMQYAKRNWKETDGELDATVVFFGRDGKATHVGFGIGNRLFIEAGGGNRETTTLEVASSQNAFVRIRPISRRADVLGIFDPIRNPLKEEK